MSSDQKNTAQDAHGVAKITLDNLTQFQKELHLPPDEDFSLLSNEEQNKPLTEFLNANTTGKFLLELTELVQAQIEANKNRMIDSHFSAICKRMSWATHLPVKMECTNSDSSGITYTCNNKFDFFINCYMATTLPAIKVKDEWAERYRICWPHNLGTNIVKEGVLRYDDDTAQSIDNVWYDIYGMLFIKPGFRDLYNTMIGNIDCLENWTTSLPGYTTSVNQPWDYSRSLSLAVPLCLCSKSRVTHTYTPRLKIADLLRVNTMSNYKEYKSDKSGKIKPIWKPGKYNAKFLLGVPKDGTISTPEMWGRYVLVTDAERDWHKTSSPSVRYIQDIIKITSDNPKTYGETESLKIISTTPCNAMIWVAENVNATKIKNISNYTTDIDNVYSGWNPCQNATLMLGNSCRFQELPSHHFDRMEPYYYFRSPPTEAGYNACSFSFDPNNLDSDVGITFDKNYSLKIKLGNTCPFLNGPKTIGSVNEDEDCQEPEELDAINETKSKDNNPTFLIHARLLVTKKLVTEIDHDTGFIVRCKVPKQ